MATKTAKKKVVTGSKVAGKKVAKKTPATEAPKGKAKGKKVAPAKDRTVRNSWTAPRVAIVTAMRAIGATSATNAKSAADIAGKAKVGEDAVKHYCYKNQWLATQGLVVPVTLEGSRTLAYYLTPAGKSAKMEG